MRTLPGISVSSENGVMASASPGSRLQSMTRREKRWSTRSPPRFAEMPAESSAAPGSHAMWRSRSAGARPRVPSDFGMRLEACSHATTNDPRPSRISTAGPSSGASSASIRPLPGQTKEISDVCRQFLAGSGARLLALLTLGSCLFGASSASAATGTNPIPFQQFKTASCPHALCQIGYRAPARGQGG